MDNTIGISPAETKELVSKIISTANEKGGIRNVFCVACGGSRGCF